jgi:hypothetical protein
MPALPWITVSKMDPDAECTVMASKLPLRSYRHIPGFLRWTLRIRRQLATSPGLVGYALDARLLRKTFWTLSAWTGRPELAKFNGSDPHHAAVKAIRSRMLPTTFVTWTCRAGDLPVAWDEARDRIEQADLTPAGRPSRR